MSAYMVESENYRLLGKTIFQIKTRYGVHFVPHETATKQVNEIISTLENENARSLACRYPNDDHSFEPVGETWKHCQLPILTAMEVFKMLDCIEYQSCEAPDYWQTEAAGTISRLRSTVARRMLRGYEEAAGWGSLADRKAVAVPCLVSEPVQNEPTEPETEPETEPGRPAGIDPAFYVRPW